MNHNHKRLTILLTTLTLLLLTASTAYALVNWNSDYVYVYDDGSTLSLPEGTTATYETSANTGTTVAFTDLSVNSDPANDWNITITTADVTLTKFDLTTYLTYSVSALGTQNFTCPQPSYVRLDNTLVNEGTGWTYDSGTGTINVNGATATVSISYTSTPPEPEENSPYNSTVLYMSLALFTIVPLVLGSAYVIKVVKTREADTKEVLTIIVLTIAVTIIAVVAVVIIYNMSLYM